MLIDAYDLATDANITYRQLDYWTRVGYITAQRQQPGQGRSTRNRVYDDTNADRARLMGKLVNSGLTAQAAHIAATHTAVYGITYVGWLRIELNDPCELCDDPLPPDAEHAHDDCLQASRSDDDGTAWTFAHRPHRSVETIANEGRFT